MYLDIFVNSLHTHTYVYKMYISQQNSHSGPNQKSNAKKVEEKYSTRFSDIEKPI